MLSKSTCHANQGKQEKCNTGFNSSLPAFGKDMNI